MKAFFTFLAAVIITAGVSAQSPMKMSYQAVIRNTSDELVTNQPIGLRISILQGHANGTFVYTETQTAVSNSIGLVSIEVGGGPGFDAINWANGPYFIKTETDPEGGTNYTITNTSQLLSVPYALHAKTAEAFSDGITETDPVFGASPAKSISGSDIINWNNKQDKLIAGNHIVITGDTINALGLPPDGTSPGEMVYWNGNAWVLVPAGTHGKILYFCNGVPTWGGCPSLLTTAAVSGITTTTAISGGYISSDGGTPVTARGVCWSTSASPGITDNHTMNGSDTGTFISNLTNLLPNTTYYVRTYATNSVGTAYGNEVSFTTSSLNQTAVCFATPDGVNDYNWSYKDYVIPEGYKLDSVYMDASRPGYSEDKYDLLIAFCPGTATYKSTMVRFLFDYETIFTSMYNTWLDLSTMAVKATGMVRVKLPTHERAVWNKLCFAVSEISDSGWKCGESFTVNHVAGSVAPVTKTVTYGTVTNVPGEPTKCWITQNLGADHQAIAVDDYTEASAGWYWQFNHKQGYKHDSITRTPNITWISSIDEDSDWTPQNDPCSLELGSGWRIPTSTEWTNAVDSGNLTDNSSYWNSDLKIHPAGHLETDGSLWGRPGNGPLSTYGSSNQYQSTLCWLNNYNWTAKALGFSIRCLKDASSQSSIPTVTTAAISSTTSTSATAGGEVNSDGGTSVTARGVCWSVSKNPTINDPHTTNGSGTGTFVSNMTVLQLNTTYYIRAYATNSEGTAYGNEVSFTTVTQPMTVTDADGNVYNTVTIGTQVWMIENLKTTKFNDGSSIPNITDSTEWPNLTTPGYCWYNNDISYKYPYGALYNQFAVNTGKLAPIGWHVPTSDDWYSLIDYLKINAYGYGGTGSGIAKSIASTSGWVIPQPIWTPYGNLLEPGAVGLVQSNNNSSGFNGYPTGLRRFDGSFDPNGYQSVWWSAKVSWDFSLSFDSPSLVQGGDHLTNGYSVRCLRDASSQSLIPTVTTAAISNSTSTSAKAGGEVTFDDGAAVTTRGVCWSTSTNPTTANSYTVDGSGTGMFASFLTGLSPNTLYYVRAYAVNSIGTAYGNEISFNTGEWSCGSSITINHLAGEVAPVTKTVTYGTVTNVPGEPTKCWITQNLGADHQATAVNDTTEASAGWYWQFNRKQGYKHDGITRTPNTTWISNIIENSDWKPTNDPCTIEFGNGWRIPSYSEWNNVFLAGTWVNSIGPWNSRLKLHASGFIYHGALGISPEGSGVRSRGELGNWNSSSQYDNYCGWILGIYSMGSNVGNHSKEHGESLRCIKD